MLSLQPPFIQHIAAGYLKIICDRYKYNVNVWVHLILRQESKSEMKTKRNWNIILLSFCVLFLASIITAAFVGIIDVLKYIKFLHEAKEKTAPPSSNTSCYRPYMMNLRPSILKPCDKSHFAKPAYKQTPYRQKTFWGFSAQKHILQRITNCQFFRLKHLDYKNYGNATSYTGLKI